MPYWSKAFDGVPECVSEAREHTRKLLGDREGAVAVELVVSELAGNAVRHSDSGAPGGRFTVHLAGFYDRWQVRVDDEGGPNMPHVCVPVPMESAKDLDALGDEIEVGRGLTLVAAVSSAWGVLGDQAGRTVWVEILMPRIGRRDRSLELPGGQSAFPLPLHYGKAHLSVRQGCGKLFERTQRRAAGESEANSLVPASPTAAMAPPPRTGSADGPAC